MSFPNIPDVNPDISISQIDDINLLLASIAFEELGLSHIINAEGEKIQFVIGTLPEQSPATPPTIDDLLEIDRSVEKTLRSVIKNQMLLQFKLEDIISISTTTSTSTSTTTSTSTSTTTTSTTTTSTTSTTTTTSYQEAGSAWSVGTQFGDAPNSGYFTLASDQSQTSAVLGLGAAHTPVGTVDVVRSGNNLLVTFTTNSPYVMSQAHLYVNNIPPTDSAPGQLGNTYDPGSFFTTHTFTIDVSAFAGETIYIAAHALIFQPA